MEDKMRSKKYIKILSKYIKSGSLTQLTTKLMIAVLFVVFAVVVISYARGYRVDFQKQTLASTGIFAISSSPKAAKVFINGEFKGVTDLNISLEPGTYTIEIQKDGYTSYTKTLTLKGEIVEAVDPILFPINPSLSPLTNLGIVKAVQVDQSDKILLFSENESPEKDGIYLFETSQNALSLFPPLKTIILKSQLPTNIGIADTIVHFSYDFKQAIFDFQTADKTTKSYLLSLENENQAPLEVTESKTALLTAWDTERQQESEKILETFPKEISKIASDSFSIVSYSPDQTKILYKAKKNINLPLVIVPPLIASDQTQEERSLILNNVYVYDKKEDKNFKIGDEHLNTQNVTWYSDSKRLVYNEGKQISISLYDGQTKQVVYSGPIESGFFAVNSDGKLLILANLNPLSNKLPDVYQVGIR